MLKGVSIIYYRFCFDSSIGRLVVGRYVFELKVEIKSLELVLFLESISMHKFIIGCQFHHY